MGTETVPESEAIRRSPQGTRMPRLSTIRCLDKGSLLSPLGDEGQGLFQGVHPGFPGGLRLLHQGEVEVVHAHLPVPQALAQHLAQGELRHPVGGE